MSNPCINRWGMNTFWYSFWYSDNNYASNLKQDAAFNRLLHTFLFYGLNLPHNIFANLYWYAKNFKRNDFPIYFRWIEKFDKTLRIRTKYIIRNESDCIFPMRLWVLRYGSWLIINLYWFHPFKRKRKMKVQWDKTEGDAFIIPNPNTSSNIKKLKTLLSVQFFDFVLTKSYYKF